MSSGVFLADALLTVVGVGFVGCGAVNVAASSRTPGIINHTLERRGAALGLIGLVLLILAAGTHLV